LVQKVSLWMDVFIQAMDYNIENMKELIKRHHAATWERGMITPETCLFDFMQKITEEYHELNNAYQEFSLSSETIHEAVDLCATIINMLKFYGYDFIQEYRKNVEHQENRI